MNTRRVVVTGIGALTPIGNSLHDYWTALKNGVSGAAPITHFNAENFKTQFACEVKDFEVTDFINRKEARKLDKFSQYALVVADEAFNDSGLNVDEIDSDRAGVIWGSGIGGINTFEKQHKRLIQHPRKVSPYFIPSMISDIAAGQISIKYGFKGINYGIVSACATGSHAIGDAYRQIKYGDADIIVSGGAEAPISPMSIAGFSNMKALTKNPDINTACRPFDIDRDGFVMGEGAGILVLESEKSALKRNTKILCEIVGYGATAKSCTVLNYCSITSKEINYFMDTTPDKINKYLPGSKILVKKYQKLRFIKIRSKFQKKK